MAVGRSVILVLQIFEADPTFDRIYSLAPKAIAVGESLDNQMITSISRDLQFQWGDAIHGIVTTILALLVISQFLSLFAGTFSSSAAFLAFRQLEKYRGYILLALLTIGLGSCLLGSYLGVASATTDSTQSAQDVPRFFSDHLYQAWGQFFGEGDVTRDDSIWTRLGRMFGLTFLAMLAYEAFVRFFAEPVQSLRMLLQRQHVVICGLGRIGRTLAVDLLRNRPVTIIEQNPLRSGIEEMRELGAIVLVADAMQERNLLKAGCHKAKEVFIVTGSDEVNLDIAADIMKQHSTCEVGTGLPKLHVHLHHMRLESVLQQNVQRIVGHSCEIRPLIRAFNPLEESLSNLFDEYVIKRRPKKAEEVAHYILVGFGSTNQALAIFLAENAHFSNLKRSRMTIVHRSDERSSVQMFQSLYPKFFPTGVTEPVDPWNPPGELDLWSHGVQLVNSAGTSVSSSDESVDWNRCTGVTFAVNGGFVEIEGGITSPVFVDRLTDVCKTPRVRPLVFVGSSNDEENCAEAIELRELLDERLKVDNRSRYGNLDHEVSLFAYVPDHPSLFELMNSRLQVDHSPDCVAWGDCKTSCTYDQLNSELVRKLAEELYRDFYRDRSKSLSSASPWEIQSNRKAALHLNAKMSVFSLKIISPPGSDASMGEQLLVERSQITDAQQLLRHCIERQWSRKGLSLEPQKLDAEFSRLMEATVRMEHNRYLAERLLQDWAVGERNPKGKLENRRRPGMVDWDHLRPSDQQKDHRQIQRILDAILLYSQSEETVQLNLAYRNDGEDQGGKADIREDREESMHLNPDGFLLPEIAVRLRRAKKNRSLWARRASQVEEVVSLEGKHTAKPGDYVCRGIAGEFWPQSEKSLLGGYTATGQVDGEGFERYDPRPNGPLVEAMQMENSFFVIASWGRLDGESGDYVVRRQTEPTDVWIVNRSIFENSYQFLPSERDGD